MAHTKAQGSVKGNRDSRPKALGVKLYEGETVINGNIIIRQRGATFKAGKGTKIGKDFTIYAIEDGKVAFKTLRGKNLVEVIHG
jgi:large subunit ribosomal protein L27